MNVENGAGVESRRVDVADSTHDAIATLCFAATKEDLRVACPGTTFLGMARRDDLELLDDPTPRLDDLDYVE